MGSGSSRGKKVAPASVNEINAFKRDDNTVHVSKVESHLFKPLKKPKLTNLNQSRNITQQLDCHSEGHDSEFSAEDDDIDVGLDRVLEEYDNRELRSKRKTFAKMLLIGSDTNGFCNSRRVYNESDSNLTPHLQSCELSEGTGAHCPYNGSVGVINKDKNVFHHFSKDTHIQFPSGTQENDFLTKGTCVESVPRIESDSVPVDSHGPSLSMPVILYDGSEVDLMETIEREFS
ncbi:uncharacterized protein LOC115172425 [Salmo trutta]|uniref:uncharacterized protein LOC115172425 n=1 Tax=Salmo trutta TaxID=8032 RepID=UPI0011316DF9|nr:uncharacterized protein LOC115172425 [Salmo trutta]